MRLEMMPCFNNMVLLIERYSIGCGISRQKNRMASSTQHDCVICAPSVNQRERLRASVANVAGFS